MYIIHVAPTSLLISNLFNNIPYYMVEVEYITAGYKDYINFHRNVDSYVILNHNINYSALKPIQLLSEAIELIQPDEVVLPDISDGSIEDNLNSIYGAMSFLSNNNLKYMVVPHGRSLKQYTECAETLLQISGISTIGITNHVEREIGTSRLDLLNKLIPIIPEEINIHLLGCTMDMIDIHDIKVQKRVRSMNTSKFVKWGMIHLTPTYGNIPTETGHWTNYLSSEVNELQIAYISKNMRYWNRLVDNE